jgi:hypothetical protein
MRWVRIKNEVDKIDMQKRQELSAAFENEVIHGKGSGNGK